MTSLRDKHFSKYEVQNNFQGAGDDMRRWVLFSWAKARQDEAAMCWQAGSLAQLLRDLASEGVISILPAIKSVAPHGVDGFEVLDASTFHRYSPLVRSHGEHHDFRGFISSSDARAVLSLAASCSEIESERPRNGYSERMPNH